MAFPAPSLNVLHSVAAQCGLSLSEADLASFAHLMAPSIEACRQLDAMPDEVPQVRYGRTPGYRPNREEDPHNIWYRKTEVRGAGEGTVDGLPVGLMLVGRHFDEPTPYRAAHAFETSRS